MSSIIFDWVLCAWLLRVGLGLRHGNICGRHRLVYDLLGISRVIGLCHKNSLIGLRSLVGNKDILMMILMAELMQEPVTSNASVDDDNDGYQNENRYYRSQNHSNIIVSAVIIVTLICKSIAV